MFRQISCLAIVLVAFSGISQAQYFSDFEADGGGWAASGDWERGTPIGVVGTALGGFGGPEPTGGFSGDFVFGTVIGGLHSASTTSQLTQTFDFTGLLGVELSFQEWIDSGGSTFDQAKVFVNGDELYLSDGGPTAWRGVTLDLGAYDGLSAVDVNFQFLTTTVVERVGWYIDDVSISAIPEPASLGLFATALLGVLGLRRRR